MARFQVGARVEVALEEEPTAFYPAQVKRDRGNRRYDVLFDDGRAAKNVSARQMRPPAWWWLDKGEPGVAAYTHCHHRVYYNDADGNIGELKSGDLVVVRNKVKKPVRHRDRQINYFVAEILCFFEEYDPDDVDSHTERATRNPFSRYRLDTDEPPKRNGEFAVRYPSMEVRFFYFPEEIYKDRRACQRFLVGEIVETDDVVDGCHINDVLGRATVSSNRDSYISCRPTQGTQTQTMDGGDDFWDEESHHFLCQNFYDIQAKRLRRVAFDPSDRARGRQFSRHLFQPVLYSQSSQSLLSSSLQFGDGSDTIGCLLYTSELPTIYSV